MVHHIILIISTSYVEFWNYWYGLLSCLVFTSFNEFLFELQFDKINFMKWVPIKLIVIKWHGVAISIGFLLISTILFIVLNRLLVFKSNYFQTYFPVPVMLWNLKYLLVNWAIVERVRQCGALLLGCLYLNPSSAN